MYERIKKLCKERGITVNSLEKELGFARGYLCKIDKSKPSSDKLQIISNYFNVSIDYIVNGDNSRFSDENAHLIAKIRNDAELTKALKKYFNLSDKKKKHIIENINLLSE
ncbi:MAG: helix-turn-helix domain-containing protein [Eubacterium sp.]